MGMLCLVCRSVGLTVGSRFSRNAYISKTVHPIFMNFDSDSFPFFYNALLEFFFEHEKRAPVYHNRWQSIFETFGSFVVRKMRLYNSYKFIFKYYGTYNTIYRG